MQLTIDVDGLKKGTTLTTILDSAGIVVDEDGDTVRIGLGGLGSKGAIIRIEAESDDRVQVGDNVDVGENEVLDGDAVAVGGSVTIAGTVRGDAVAIGGNMILRPTACVEGDVVCVGGKITRDEGSQVEGQVVSVGPGVFPLVAPFVHGPWSGVSRAFSPLFKIIQLLVMALIVYLVIALWGARVRAIAAVLPARPWHLGLIGLLGWVLVLPSCILLVISIIGILFLPVFFALLIFAFVTGLIAVYLFVGTRLRGVVSSRLVVTALKGMLVVHACSLIGAVLGAFPPMLGPLPTILSVFGKVLVFLAGTVGFGGVLYTRFGKRNLEPPPLPGGGEPTRFGDVSQPGPVPGAAHVEPPPFPESPAT